MGVGRRVGVEVGEEVTGEGGQLGEGEEGEGGMGGGVDASAAVGVGEKEAAMWW